MLLTHNQRMWQHLSRRDATNSPLESDEAGFHQVTAKYTNLFGASSTAARPPNIDFRAASCTQTNKNGSHLSGRHFKVLQAILPKAILFTSILITVISGFLISAIECLQILKKHRSTCDAILIRWKCGLVLCVSPRNSGRVVLEHKWWMPPRLWVAD